MTDTDTAAVKVMSLNLRFGLAEDGPNNWDCRRRAYEPLLRDFPCDFYCFQEANDFQITFLSGLLQGYGHIGRRYPAPDFWQNNVIFFAPAWHCQMKDHFFLSPTPRIPSRFRRSRWPRQCTWGLFESNGRRLICVNTHFDFLPDIQTASARIIMRHLQEQPPIESVLMGDFNSEPGAECDREFTAPHEIGMIPFRHAFSPPFTSTHHGFSGGSDGRHIDWILYRGGLQVLSAEVVTGRFAGCFPSDHFALTAAFRFS